MYFSGGGDDNYYLVFSGFVVIKNEKNPNLMIVVGFKGSEMSLVCWLAN